jgi:hypothetical protein
MDRVWRGVVAVGRFFYDYIFGDDWTVAVAIFVGLALTGLLNANHIAAWWLVPAIAIGMTGISLRRQHIRA